MKPIDFEEKNVVFAEKQDEYQNLPAFKSRTGAVTTCWELSKAEKELVAENGVVWLSLLTFGHPLQPVVLTAAKELVILADEPVIDIFVLTDTDGTEYRCKSIAGLQNVDPDRVTNLKIAQMTEEAYDELTATSSSAEFFSSNGNAKKTKTK